jgi:hypothetical protein
MSDNLDERLKRSVSDNMQVEYKIPNIILYIAFFIWKYNDYCHTGLPVLEIMDKVGEKLGMKYSFTRNFSDYLLEEEILQQIRSMPKEEIKLIKHLANSQFRSIIIKNYYKCLKEGKEKYALSEYIYNFIVPKPGERPESIFYRIIY